MLATFSTNGPATCSGILVQQYDESSLIRSFESEWEQISASTVENVTPEGGV